MSSRNSTPRNAGLRTPLRMTSRTPVRSALLGCLLSAAALAPVSQAADPWRTIEAAAPAQCSDGSPYRFHLLQGDPARLFVFLNGGGACWDAATCDPEGRPTYRVHAGPGSGNDPRRYGGAFDLDNDANPFRDWSQVFVSYCSGDVHLGDRRSEYEREDGTTFAVEHRGRRNTDAALDAISETFKPRRIVIAGGSAGAIASPVYAAVLAQRFPDAEVIQFGGGGAGYRIAPPAKLWERWNTLPSLPGVRDASAHTPEALSFVDLYRLAAQAQPTLTFHTLDHAYDAVQEQFMSLLGNPAELLLGLNANLKELRDDIPKLRSYVAPGEFHTILRYDEFYDLESDGLPAVDWIREISAGDDPGNVHCHPYCD